MATLSLRPALGFRFYSWPTVAVTVLAVQAVLSLILKPGAVLTTYVLISCFLLILLAACAATVNAVQNTLGRRPFWAFLAAGYGLWSLDLWLWVYYQIGLHRKVPDSSIADPALFLHIVLLMGAVATLPHLNQSSLKLYRTTLNFLLLLFFWVFLYAYMLIPYQYLFWDSMIYNLRYNSLYFGENLALLAALGVLILRAQPPWKSIYWHLLGASGLYALSSQAANDAIDLGGYYPGCLYDVGIIAAICWFVWVPLCGRQLTPRPVQATQPDTSKIQYTSLLAMLVVVAIPVIGVWELFQEESAPQMRRFRLLVVLVSAVLLALSVFAKEYFANRGLTADINIGALRRKWTEEALHEVTGRLLRSQDEERRRIARDLHDSTAQDLVAISLNISRALSLTPESQDKTRRILAETHAVSKKCLQDVRTVSYVLHPPILDGVGLLPALRWYVRGFVKRTNTRVKLSVPTSMGRLSPEIEAAIFRIVQECLANIHRHSGSQNAVVHLVQDLNQIVLEVRDSGKGLDVQELAETDAVLSLGVGIAGMRERVRQLGGQLDIESSSAGTCVRVTVPLTEEKGAANLVG